MPLSDEATIVSLRRDLALQLSRAVLELGVTQMDAAKRLNVPQPTLSKIINGQVESLSIELLLRIAVRLGLMLTLHTSDVPDDAAVFVSRGHRYSRPRHGSKLAAWARDSLEAAHRRLTAAQRIEAFVEHSQLMAELDMAPRKDGSWSTKALSSS